MVKILGSWLRPGDSGLEWGSGRSTLWFAKRVDRLLSIEHDEYWHRRISSQILENGIHNVDYRLCLKESEYISSADHLPRESLDFVLVDGIGRDRCAMAALPLLKSGGSLVL